MKVTFGDETFDLTEEQVAAMKRALGVCGKRLSEVAVGDTFKIGDIEFIKFSEENGEAAAVAKTVVFNGVFGSNTNNFGNSNILNLLKNEVLPKIEAAVGADNVLHFVTDLTSLDGLDDYGKITSKISLPTVEFYRNNVKIFDKYAVNKWWWLSTPWSTPSHGYNRSVCCLRTDGSLLKSTCDCYCDVRPLLIFKSSVFVS